jgi:hypothetical protein
VTLPTPKRLGGGNRQHASVRRSKEQEASTALRMGGRVTKQSGGGIFEKGDVRVKSVVRVESKTTKNKSFSVTAQIIDKIETQALASGEVPVVDVEIDNAGTPRSVYVVPQWALDGIIQELQELRGRDRDGTS